jgi:hypothetical protein
MVDQETLTPTILCGAAGLVLLGKTEPLEQQLM